MRTPFPSLPHSRSRCSNAVVVVEHQHERLGGKRVATARAAGRLHPHHRARAGRRRGPQRANASEDRTARRGLANVAGTITMRICLKFETRPSCSPVRSGARASLAAIEEAKRSETMRDSAGAPDVMLTNADLATIGAGAGGGTAGPRYNEAGMARVRL